MSQTEKNLRAWGWSRKEAAAAKNSHPPNTNPITTTTAAPITSTFAAITWTSASLRVISAPVV